MANANISNGAVTAILAAEQAQVRLEKIRSGEKGLSTGFAHLDNYFRFEPGQVAIIAARPGVGKTSMVLHMARHAAKKGKKILFFTLEMAVDRCVIRMACQMADINYRDLVNNPDQHESDFLRIQKHIEEIRGWDIIFDEGPATADQIIARIEQVKESWGDLDLVFVDYAELIADRHANEVIRLSNIAMRLQQGAKLTRVPIVVISQMSREAERRESKFPVLSDLRGSGMLEQVADCVFMLFSPQYYAQMGVEVDVPDPAWEVDTLLIFVAKNREGPTGIVPVYHNQKTTRMGNWSAKRVLLNSEEEYDEAD